jgi:hypothetical protein
MKREFPFHTEPLPEKSPAKKVINDSGLITNIFQSPSKILPNEADLEVDVFDDGDDDSEATDKSVDLHQVNQEKAYLMNNPFINEWVCPVLLVLIS